MPIDRLSRLVLTSGTHPLRRIFILLQDYRGGVDFPSFPDVPAGCAAGSQLVYSQRYIGAHLLSPSEFQVPGGQLRIGAFGRKDVQCLSLIISTISHNTSDGQCISYSLLYYVDSLLQEPRLVRWSAIFLRQFCTALDRCRSHAQGRVNFPFASKLFCLFFERFPETRPSFLRQPHRSITEACMHMWGQMMPKREETLFPVRVSDDALELLASVDEYPFIMAAYPYAG